MGNFECFPNRLEVSPMFLHYTCVLQACHWETETWQWEELQVTSKTFQKSHILWEMQLPDMKVCDLSHGERIFLCSPG